MKLGQNLKIEQSLKLSMTPKLIQAIQILQFSGEELEEYIKNELLENPMLEVSKEKRERSPKDQMGDIQADYNLTVNITLTDYLMEQLRTLKISEEEREICDYLIHNIDESGYLEISISEIAEAFKEDEKEVEKALSIVQSFDPAGVGARDLKESLKLQLHRSGGLDKTVEYIIDFMLEDIGGENFDKISKELNISFDDAADIADKIRGLDPKPGRGFSSKEAIKYVMPDVILDTSEGDYKVHINEYRVPTLMLSSYYSSLKDEMKVDQELRDYVKDRLDAARWLINCINQRQDTITKITEAIVRYQRTFFEKGDKYLKPLTLKTISEDVGVHESTVSRAVREKYIQYDGGLKELKFFFSGGASYGDGSISSVGIKSRIKDLVKSEPQGNPLSDQKICEILNNEGIEISRRTVAKYRDAMGIKTSSKRKVRN